MNRKILTILAILLQLLILGSFIIRYEVLKQTGTTIYIPVTGYDPTDIFRGDYVNLAYELPYTGSIDNNIARKKYLIPEIEGNKIVNIKDIVAEEPMSGIYFQILDGWQNQRISYTLKLESGETMTYTGMDCANDSYNVGTTVYYPYYEKGTIATITTEIQENTDLWKKATILSKTGCIGTYRFRTTATDRFFVQE